MLFHVKEVILAAVLCGAGFGLAHAQGADGPLGSSPATRPDLPGAQAPGDTAGPKPLPALPGSKSPAETWRELLAMNPAERAQALADRTEPQRKYLENRLREYEAMPQEEREARLRQMDLTFHLDVLMPMAPADRAERLAIVPPTLRPLIDERLRQWDLLPASMKDAVLEYETTANYFVRARPSLPGGPTQATYATRGQNPSAGESTAKAVESFSQFLGLSPKEQQRTLEVLPPGEREEMERALRIFADLPPEQRRICIESFVKFKQMSKDEVDQFLRNAARWKAMSPRERETWRSLISILPPPALHSAGASLQPGPETGSGSATTAKVPARQGAPE
ncbi:MAG: DUF3106 domain-containing protein [Verrucomicrobiia bacterium]